MVAYVDLARKSITNSVAQGFFRSSRFLSKAFIEIASQIAYSAF